MKKIIFTLLVFALISVTALANQEILIGTPFIDGIVDNEYLQSYKIELTGQKNTFYTSTASTADGSWGDSAIAYYLYDEGYLYVCVDVKDDAVYSRGRAWIIKNIENLSWENDAVEVRIYYPELGDPAQENQYIFQCDAKGIATTNYKKMCDKEHIVSTVIGTDGYTVEFAIPLSFDKKAGDTIGLSIEVDDIHERVFGSDTPMRGHKFNAYGSQHPYDNMVKLGETKASSRITVFDDTKEHWGRNDISYVLQAELFNGMGNGFEPDTAMSRAMFATALGRMYEKKNGKLTEHNNAPKFNDVDYDSWYGKYVEWASGEGIVNGKDNNLFDPNSPITRQEMAVMLFRYTKVVFENDTLSFNDASDISDWAKKAVAYCSEKGYIGGNNENNFLPKANATRAEVSALISRYMKSLTVTVY